MLDAKIKERSLERRDKQLEIELEQARRLHWRLHYVLKDYCRLLKKEMPFPDISYPYAEAFYSIVAETQLDRSARRPNEVEPVVSMPGSWNSPLTSHYNLSSGR